MANFGKRKALNGYGISDDEEKQNQIDKSATECTRKRRNIEKTPSKSIFEKAYEWLSPWKKTPKFSEDFTHNERRRKVSLSTLSVEDQNRILKQVESSDTEGDNSANDYAKKPQSASSENVEEFSKSNNGPNYNKILADFFASKRDQSLTAVEIEGIKGLLKQVSPNSSSQIDSGVDTFDGEKRRLTLSRGSEDDDSFSFNLQRPSNSKSMDNYARSTFASPSEKNFSYLQYPNLNGLRNTSANISTSSRDQSDAKIHPARLAISSPKFRIGLPSKEKSKSQSQRLTFVGPTLSSPFRKERMQQTRSRYLTGTKSEEKSYTYFSPNNRMGYPERPKQNMQDLFNNKRIKNKESFEAYQSDINQTESSFQSPQSILASNILKVLEEPETNGKHESNRVIESPYTSSAVRFNELSRINLKKPLSDTEHGLKENASYKPVETPKQQLLSSNESNKLVTTPKSVNPIDFPPSLRSFFPGDEAKYRSPTIKDRPFSYRPQKSSSLIREISSNAEGSSTRNENDSEIKEIRNSIKSPIISTERTHLSHPGKSYRKARALDVPEVQLERYRFNMLTTPRIFDTMEKSALKVPIEKFSNEFHFNSLKTT